MYYIDVTFMCRAPWFITNVFLWTEFNLIYGKKTLLSELFGHMHFLT